MPVQARDGTAQLIPGRPISCLVARWPDLIAVRAAARSNRRTPARNAPHKIQPAPRCQGDTKRRVVDLRRGRDAGAVLTQIYGLTTVADARDVDRLCPDHVGVVVDEGKDAWDSVDEVTAVAIAGTVENARVVALSLSTDPERIRATTALLRPAVLHLARAHQMESETLARLRDQVAPSELMLTGRWFERRLSPWHHGSPRSLIASSWTACTRRRAWRERPAWSMTGL